MSLINRFKRELFLKIVYVGPTRSGKSENLRQIYAATDNQEPGGFLVHRNESPAADRGSLFFDFLPLSLGTVADFHVRLHLFSMPGSGKYDAISRMMLRGVDGIVCVLPSLPDRIEECRESIQATKELLQSYGKSWGEIPVVYQYSFQDSTLALPQQTLHEMYNSDGFPEFPARIAQGKGVLETLRGVTHEALHSFKTGEAASGASPAQ